MSKLTKNALTRSGDYSDVMCVFCWWGLQLNANDVYVWELPVVAMPIVSLILLLPSFAAARPIIL